MIKDLAPEFLQFRIKKDITRLFKLYLSILEDIKLEQRTMMIKLLDNDSNISNFNWLTDEKANSIRKKILDEGNQTLRDLEEELGKYNIEFKNIN